MANVNFAMRRALPDRDEAELFWGPHFATAKAHHTIRDSERLTKLSDGSCDLDDVEAVVDRVVSVAMMALNAPAVNAKAAGRAASAR